MEKLLWEKPFLLSPCLSLLLLCLSPSFSVSLSRCGYTFFSAPLFLSFVYLFCSLTLSFSIHPSIISTFSHLFFPCIQEDRAQNQTDNSRHSFSPPPPSLPFLSPPSSICLISYFLAKCKYLWLSSHYQMYLTLLISLF